MTFQNIRTSELLEQLGNISFPETQRGDQVLRDLVGSNEVAIGLFTEISRRLQMLEKANHPFKGAREIVFAHGEFMHWSNATVPAMSHSLHYGSSVFEGLRGYKQDNGDTAIFRLGDHVDRLIRSANFTGIKLPFDGDPQRIAEIICQTVKLNKMSDCYIRPCAYRGPIPGVKGVEQAVDDFIVAVWEWGHYNGDKAQLIPNLRRIHPDTTDVESKVGGHYVNSLRAFFCINVKDVTEAIMLDCDGNLAEGSSSNIFLLFDDGNFYTPPVGHILPGKTRDAVIQFIGDLGGKVIEGNLAPEKLSEAKGVFLTGSATEVQPLTSIVNGTGQILFECEKVPDAITRISDLFQEVVRGRVPKYSHWLTVI